MSTTSQPTPPTRALVRTRPQRTVSCWCHNRQTTHWILWYVINSEFLPPPFLHILFFPFVFAPLRKLRKERLMPSQNWPTWKKNMTLAIISLASMAGTLQGLANSSGLFQQAENYHKTAIQITYSLAASNAGLAVGPLFWTPLALRFGRCAAIFWGTLLTLLFNVWGARCTGESDYISFTLSRLFASIAGSCATTSSSPFSFCIFRLLPCTENSSRPN
jgi:hypothetical protein